MRKTLVVALVALLCLGLVGMAVAKSKGSKPVKVKTIPFIDNPAAGLATAAWVTHQGLPDAGKSGHALYFWKDSAAPEETVPGAKVSGVNGLILTELGFDYRTDGLARAVSMVVTDSGTGTATFTIASGISTVIDTDWTRVRFTVPPDLTVASINIYFDWGADPPTGSEADFIYLDNIDVNGALMGKPGNAKVPK